MQRLETGKLKLPPNAVSAPQHGADCARHPHKPAVVVRSPQQASGGGRSGALGHREVGIDVAGFGENCVSIIHDVRSFGEQGVETFHFICFISI